jgi:anti-anti-sigma factor
MALRTETRGKVAILYLDESFTTHDGEKQFVSEYRALLDQGLDLVLDLNHVDFLDSARIACLVICFKRVNECGRIIHFAGVGSAIRETLKMTRLDRVFLLFGSRQEAIAAIESPRPKAGR